MKCQTHSCISRPDKVEPANIEDKLPPARVQIPILGSWAWQEIFQNEVPSEWGPICSRTRSELVSNSCNKTLFEGTLSEEALTDDISLHRKVEQRLPNQSTARLG